MEILIEYNDINYYSDCESSHGGNLEFNKLKNIDGEPTVVGYGGYVRAELVGDYSTGHYLVTVVNADGDVLSETIVPFDFNEPIHD